MADYDRRERWSLPLTCRQGHQLGPHQVTANWAECDCPSATVDPGCGHLVVHCRSRWDETGRCDADALFGTDEDGALRTGADRDGPRAASMPCTAWTLLLQAHEHHKSLLRPSTRALPTSPACTPGYESAWRLSTRRGDWKR